MVYPYLKSDFTLSNCLVLLNSSYTLIQASCRHILRDTHGRRKHLTPSEKCTIIAHASHNMTEREISEVTGRSKTAIHDVLTKAGVMKTKDKRGKKGKSTERERRTLVRKARPGGFTARKLQKHFKLRIGVQRIQQILADAEYCDFDPLKKVPKLTPAHRAGRLDWCEQFVAKEVVYWDSVIFSDEKRFCLDGPDGNQYFWADKRICQDHFAKRPKGGGGLMVWAGVSSRGKTPLVFVEGTMDGPNYVSIMEDHLMPLVEDEFLRNGVHPIYQQDHASCHTGHVAQEFFTNEGLDVLPWAPKSPDLNIIENIWGILVYRVYYGYRQFETLDDLKEALLYEWDKLELRTIQKLARSMPKRISKVIRARGHPISY